LLTDQKPLLTALTRVSTPSFGRQQRHLSFISEYTDHLVYIPGMSNVVADALSQSASDTAGSELLPALQTLPTGPPSTYGTWPSIKSSALRKKLFAPARGCALSCRKSVTSQTSRATLQQGCFDPWYRGTSADRFSTAYMAPHTQVCKPPAASSPPEPVP
jgi:hypothetical protein